MRFTFTLVSRTLLLLVSLLVSAITMPAYSQEAPRYPNVFHRWGNSTFYASASNQDKVFWNCSYTIIFEHTEEGSQVTRYESGTFGVPPNYSGSVITWPTNYIRPIDRGFNYGCTESISSILQPDFKVSGSADKLLCGPGLPDGSYQESCYNCRVNGCSLECNCKKSNGRYQFSSVSISNCAASPLRFCNREGFLQCGEC